jgi:glycosyltransferase involved in cell wall biosynthesis
LSIPYPILFVTSNLGGGGGERVLVNIINHLDRTRFQPHLALYQKEGVFLRELASDVPVHEIQPMGYGFLYRNWVRMRAMKRLCDQLHPVLVMSVLWQVNIVTILADTLFGLGCPVVVNEQTALKMDLQSQWQRHIFWPLAHRVYKRAAKVIAVSSGIASELQETLSLSPDKFQVIHNSITLDEIRDQSSLSSVSLSMIHPRLVAVGRLARSKNYPLLLRAVGRVVREEPVSLYVLGEGSERSRLEKLIRDLGLHPVVRLLGFQRNPYAYMRQADVFVLSSDYEGFGNVIIEAMALGVPVIATDCPYGPREILAGGKYGVLVPPGDEQALADAILSLLRDPDGRRRLGAEAKKRAEEFSMEKIVLRYERLFLDLVEAEM